MKKALKIAGLLVLALAVTVTAALWSSIRELKKLAAEEILAPRSPTQPTEPGGADRLEVNPGGTGCHRPGRRNYLY